MFAAAAGGAAALAATPLAAAPEAPKGAFFELRYYYMRNSRTNQTRRTASFVSTGYAPAARRAGIGPVGVFSAVIAPESPFLLVLSGYPSLAGMQASLEKMEADAEYQKALADYTSDPELAYIRMESTLLRCLDVVPTIEAGPAPEGRGGRTFELRTYESDNQVTVKRKARMFAEGEVAVFRKCGLQPVFFGEALVGPKLPRITYMVAYDSMAGREKAWSAFGGDPDWRKLQSQPGYADAEIVANISNVILRAGAGSEIR
jgi:hypothetical protein